MYPILEAILKFIVQSLLLYLTELCKTFSQFLLEIFADIWGREPKIRTKIAV